MTKNIFIKIITSLPLILLTLYFSTFLGICLIILRCFVHGIKRNLSLALIIIGLIILVPKGLSLLPTKSIPYIQDIINSNIYPELINYSKTLLIIGVILLILSAIASNLSNKLISYIQKQEQIDEKVSKQNDMEIKLKQEKAKNTKVVYCPYCGADNILTEKIGTCKYCRRQLEQK